MEWYQFCNWQNFSHNTREVDFIKFPVKDLELAFLNMHFINTYLYYHSFNSF